MMPRLNAVKAFALFRSLNHIHARTEKDRHIGRRFYIGARIEMGCGGGDPMGDGRFCRKGLR